jgi:hypothetical protein
MITYLEYKTNLTHTMIQDEVTDVDDYGFYADIDSGIVLPYRYCDHIRISKKIIKWTELDDEAIIINNNNNINKKINISSMMNINRACFIGFSLSLSLIALRFLFRLI